MVFNATYYNISVISWRSVLLVEETGVHGENHRSAVGHWLKSHEDTFNGEIFSIINECKARYTRCKFCIQVSIQVS